MDLLKNQIQNTLQIREDLMEEVKTEDQLLALMEQLVQELVNAEFEHLLRLLYRIDLSEAKVKEAIAATGPERASLSIAKLILEREKEKAASREKYGSGENIDWEF